MKILLLGSGAREAAIAHALASDPQVSQLYVAPGNPGIGGHATALALPGGITDGQAVAAMATELDVDLVVIGPELPLVAGVADAVRAVGIACFGPSADAAQLEGSKAFAKDVMAAAGVATAGVRVCDSLPQVEAALAEFGAPYVVKDDGLAAGKGVVVTDDRALALKHAAAALAGRVDGRVIVEQFLDGPEVSLFCLTDGTTVLPLAPAADFKRVGEGDTGPNTGGMGAYSPLDWAPPGLVDEVVRTVALPTITEMARRGTPFSGLLYIGLALTASGPQVVEFNARFGDPETQVVLARLETPLAGLLMAAASGTLAQVPPLRWREAAAVTVVLAAENYPGSPITGDVIDGLDAAVFTGPDAPYVLHAGTALDADGRLVAAGGRVLCVVGLGDDLGQARQVAYSGVDAIELRGSHYRRDIAAAAHRGEVSLPAAYPAR